MFRPVPRFPARMARLFTLAAVILALGATNRTRGGNDQRHRLVLSGVCATEADGLSGARPLGRVDVCRYLHGAVRPALQRVRER